MNPAELFARESNPLRLAADEVLFKAGERGDSMYVVLEGALESVVDDRVVGRATRGDIIGEMALIDESPRSGTVMAREASTLVKVDAARFQRLIQQNPFFAMHVMKVLVDRVRRVDHVRPVS
jgi:CRP/FNR family cyclic AMP-dependent transcriptional regulator